MFEGVGRSRDEEALKRSAQSVVATAVLSAAITGAILAWGAYRAAVYIAEEVLDDEDMIEFVMEDETLEAAPPPPPPPCLLYTSPSPRDATLSRMPSSA